MADHGAAAAGDAHKTKLEERKAYWKKERVEKRKEFLS